MTKRVEKRKKWIYRCIYDIMKRADARIGHQASHGDMI